MTLPELPLGPPDGPWTSTCPECGGVMEEVHGWSEDFDECRDCGYQEALFWQEPDHD